MDIHTLENNIVKKGRSEVDIVMISVETRVQDAVMSAIEKLVISRVKLSMKSVNASSGRGADSIVLDPEWRYFSGNIEGRQLTTLNRLNSHTDLNRFDETRGNLTVEEGDLSVRERKIDRPTYTHQTDTHAKTM